MDIRAWYVVNSAHARAHLVLAPAGPLELGMSEPTQEAEGC